MPKKPIKVHNGNAINPKVTRLPTGQIQITHDIDPNSRAPKHIKKLDIDALQSLLLKNARDI